MARLRQKLPVIFCIAAYALWFIGQNGIALLFFKITGMRGNALSISGEIGAILMMLLVLHFTDRFHLLKEKGTGFGRGLLMGVAMLCLGAVVAAAMIAINTQPLNSAPTILSFCVYMFTVGMAEETLCRGVMAESLLEHFGTGRAGIWKAILISSLMFGLTHFVNLVNGASLAGTVSQALDAFTIGLVFSVIYFRSGNLWVTILLHAIWDFSTMLMVEDGLFVTSTTLSDKISDMSDAGHISLFVPVSFAALAVFLLHSPKQYAQVGQWFDPYCAKNIKEEK